MEEEIPHAIGTRSIFRKKVHVHIFRAVSKDQMAGNGEKMARNLPDRASFLSDRRDRRVGRLSAKLPLPKGFGLHSTVNYSRKRMFPSVSELPPEFRRWGRIGNASYLSALV